ncbi:MAG: hypothetical protein M3179_12620 [Actinomycetota bacterium]|nr:hypothetical protein [Actinomycetota bacterium]
MKLLTGTKKRSRAELEHEAAEELEAVVRAGQTPPPADWTLVPGADTAATESESEVVSSEA